MKNCSRELVFAALWGAWDAPEFRGDGCEHQFAATHSGRVFRARIDVTTLFEKRDRSAPSLDTCAIVGIDSSFLAPLGINQHRTPNRRNAIAGGWDTIRPFAETHLKSANS
jgi:hypothetical protein